jgi:hypothetical protein
MASNKATDVIGVPGLSIWGGVVAEEWLPQLKGVKGRKVLMEMARDSTIGTLLDAMIMPLLAAEFGTTPSVKVGAQSESDKNAAQFVWECMNDMTRYSWRQHVLDQMSMLTFGWAASEIVMKKRNGWEDKRPSQYDDGLLGLHILDPRGQETLDHWTLDNEGNVTEMIQCDPMTGRYCTIPAWKMVHSTWRSRKRNPEGQSPLGDLYQSWFYKKNHSVLEGILVERSSAGLPVLKLPYGATKDDAAQAATLVKNLRVDENAGVVLPPPRIKDSPQMWDLSLLQGTQAPYDIGVIISRYQKEILLRFFAQFLALGMDKAGTQALVKGSHDFFSLALKSIQQELLDTWNQQLVPFLINQNNMREGLSGYPLITWNDPGKFDVQALSMLMKELVGANVLTPEENLEDFIRDAAGLPERPEGVGVGERARPSFFPPAGQPNQPNEGGDKPVLPQTDFALEDKQSGPFDERKSDSPIARLTNDYQKELLAIYDKWVAEMGLGRVNADILAKQMKAAGERALTRAITMAMKQPDQALIQSQIERNNKFIDESLIPSLLKAIGTKKFAGIADILNPFRATIAQYAGATWLAFWTGKQEEGRGQPRRIRWVLDPNSKHCKAREDYPSCPEMAHEYGSWNDLSIVPGGASCGISCRCSLEIMEGSQWIRP